MRTIIILQIIFLCFTYSYAESKSLDETQKMLVDAQDETELWRYSGYQFGYTTGLKDSEKGEFEKPDIAWKRLTEQDALFRELVSNIPIEQRSQFQTVFKEGLFEGYLKGLYGFEGREKDYIIVAQEDLSMKAFPNPLSQKPLSRYTTKELDRLPMCKRIKFGIIIKPGLEKDEYEKIIHKIISDISLRDKDIDVISLHIFDSIDALNSAYGIYNIAHAVWSPSGSWDTVTPKIASSNDRKGYKTEIKWSSEYEHKADGVIEVIRREQEGYEKSKTPKEFISDISFDRQSGSLKIVDYLTSGYGANTNWADECTEHNIYLAAEVMLKHFVLPFPEITSYSYTLFWGYNEVFSFITDRKELDSLNINKIFKEFDAEANRQEDLYGIDIDKERELELRLYYRKIFNHFKNKELKLVSKGYREITLEGIVWDEKDPIAIINGSLFKKGDFVGTKKIIGIYRDRIDVEDNFGIVNIKLD